jgi:hypothetical protein
VETTLKRQRQRPRSPPTLASSGPAEGWTGSSTTTPDARGPVRCRSGVRSQRRPLSRSDAAAGHAPATRPVRRFGSDLGRARAVARPDRATSEVGKHFHSVSTHGPHL